MSTCINCVWEEFSVPLKRFIKKRVANEQDVDDIFQEIYLKIHKNIGSVMNEDKIHAWIYRVARNTINYRRNHNKFEITDLTENLESSTNEESSANIEIASCLKEMVDSLPETYKQAILLTEFKNMTQKELSEKLGISISGAKSRVQRARKMLKEMLLSCCQLEIDRRGNIIDYRHKNSECKYC
ncbi:MAG: RNA polymerase sigma factor SigZ [Desulfitobacterium hafniense]|nr:RNA polymerase sigma factor SigZ [Desulfosporosinus sp.]MDA8227404.1 RNA polymerase sigma factor SigZ [Desulfitobacterium hafniense]